MTLRPILPLVAAACASAAPVDAADDAPPNVVLILADDLGWTDLGCYGSEYYRTPRIDELRAGGMRFDAAYSTGPNCAPTRASLMTGLYPPRHGIYTVASGARGKAEHRRLVPVENVVTLASEHETIAELLDARGYATAHFGKWHLGSPDAGSGPRAQGFDVNVAGNHTGSPKGGYFSPYKNPQLDDGDEGEHLTDRLADEVVRFLEAHHESPFFVYLPFYAVHTPIQAKESLTDEYRQRDAHGGHGNAKYAAMIETMDVAVGRVLHALDRLDVADDTLVVFTSDNGGLGGYSRAGVDGARDITDNAPLRGGKGMLYEGGIRVPLIARWPGRVEAGSSCATPTNSVDWLPTLAAVAGAERSPTDGVSLVPLLTGGQIAERDLFWHFPGYLQASAKKGTWRTTPVGVIRSGGWKLLEFFEDDRVELYHVEQDVGEERDLAAEEPDQRDELLARLRAWRDEVDAPMPRAKD